MKIIKLELTKRNSLSHFECILEHLLTVNTSKSPQEILSSQAKGTLKENNNFKTIKVFKR